MQTRLPDIKELQELDQLPAKIESEMKSATKKLKRVVLENFVALNDWVFKTSNPAYWIDEFYALGDFRIYHEKGNGKETIAFKKYVDRRGSVALRHCNGRPMFEARLEYRAGSNGALLTYSYYFDENDVFVESEEDKIPFMTIPDAKKMIVNDINRLENHVKELSNSIGRIKDRMFFTRELKKKRRSLMDLDDLNQHVNTFDDEIAVKFFDSILRFITVEIPNRVNKIIDDKRKALERARELTGEEKKTVPMPTLDEIVKQSDDNFKAWNDHSNKLV